MRFTVFLVALLLFSMDVSAQDWANLERYRKANQSVRQSGESQGRVVFMGDSITEGWTETYPEFFEGKPYVNRGISGQTTPQMLVRFRPDVIDLDPSVVVILAGTNDVAGNTGPAANQEIAGNIISMAELARANGVKVLIASILPAADYPWSPGLKPDVRIPAVNGLLKEYCQSAGVSYLDYFSEMVAEGNALREDLTYDGVHLNADGYALMSRLASAAIEAAMGH